MHLGSIIFTKVRLSLQNKKAYPIITVLFVSFLSTASSWPGWISNDSLQMYQQATSGIYDNWHSPFLSWAWSLGLPNLLGPLIPYAIQQVVFWAGVLLLTIEFFRRHGFVTLLFPFLVILMAHTWVLGWIWKDAAILSLLSLFAGLRLNLRMAKTVLKIRILKSFLVTLLAIACAIRPYMAPSILILLFSIFSNKDLKKIKYAAKLQLFIFIISVTLLTFVVPRILQTEEKFPQSSLYLQDLATMQCLGNEKVIPKEFIIQKTENICDNFNLFTLDKLVYGDPKSSRLRFATTAQENSDLHNVWKSNLLNHSGELLTRRVLLTSDLMRNADSWIFPLNSTLDSQVGSGQEIGYESSRNTVYRFMFETKEFIENNKFSSFIFNSSLLYIVLLPLLALISIIRTISFLRFEIYWLVFPICWVCNFAAISPWHDTRYVAPATLFGLFAFLASTSNLLANESF